MYQNIPNEVSVNINKYKNLQKTYHLFNVLAWNDMWAYLVNIELLTPYLMDKLRQGKTIFNTYNLGNEDNKLLDLENEQEGIIIMPTDDDEDAYVPPSNINIVRIWYMRW
jgi:hypothetical protein